MIEKNLLMMPILEGIEKAKGCPLCYLWLKKEKEIMSLLLLDEIVVSSKFMDEVLTAKGFCNRHMHLLYETAYNSYTEDGLTYALYMRVIIEKIIEQFQSLSPSLLNQIKESISSNVLVRVRKMRKTFSSLRNAFGRRLMENLSARHVNVCGLLMRYA